MQISKKRLRFLNRDLLINHPVLKGSFSECEKCNYNPSPDSNYCDLCYKKLFDNDE